MIAGRVDHLAHPLVLREQSHRRVTLIAIALLLVLGTSPVYARHLFALNAAQVLAGIDHLGTLCLTAIHLLLQPVHDIFRIIILAGLSYATWDRLRAWLRMRRALAPLDERAPAPGDQFARGALAVGADLRRIRIVAGLPNPAFTVGLLAPRSYLAEELAERLTPEQLEAVIAHEHSHVVRRDPLRLFLLRLLGDTLFWIPALRRLADDMRDEAEVRADDAAARGRPLVLASALLALSAWRAPAVRVPTAVGFERDDLLERRVRRLLGEDAPVRSHLTRRSVFSAGLVLTLVWASGIIMAHPLPADSRVTMAAHSSDASHSAHCQHHGESAVAHLFCLGAPFSRSVPEDCPHRAG